MPGTGTRFQAGILCLVSNTSTCLLEVHCSRAAHHVYRSNSLRFVGTRPGPVWDKPIRESKSGTKQVWLEQWYSVISSPYAAGGAAIRPHTIVSGRPFRSGHHDHSTGAACYAGRETVLADRS